MQAQAKAAGVVGQFGNDLEIKGLVNGTRLSRETPDKLAPERGESCRNGCKTLQRVGR